MHLGYDASTRNEDVRPAVFVDFLQTTICEAATDPNVPFLRVQRIPLAIGRMIMLPCRWCYYKETERVLGQTFGVLVLQDFEVWNIWTSVLRRVANLLC